MLTTLHIRNLAIADDLEIELTAGFNVMTGETGAGKSIVVDAVALLSGGRAWKELIRTGSDRAVVEGVFTDIGAGARTLLEEMGLPDAPDITVKRVIHADGPSRAYVNGELVTQGQLMQLGRELVQIHSQNDQQLLLQPDHHLTFLDRFGGHEDSLRELAARTAAVREARDTYRKLIMDEREKNQRIDMLKFQISDIESADLKPGEVEQLAERKAVLKNMSRIRDLLTALEQLLEDPESGPLAERLGRLHLVVEKLAALQPRFEGYVSQLADLHTLVTELERDAAQAGLDLSEDGPSLDEIEARLVAIERIQRKYGEDYDTVQQHLNRCREELGMLEELAFRLTEAAQALQAAHRRWMDAATALTEARQQAAVSFARALEDQLKGLAMPDVQVEIALVTRRPEDDEPETILNWSHSERGLDEAEILISPNPGEDLKPLTKIASGGEVSRIMLAVNILTAPEDAGATAVFDEVDAGIGGQTALSLADRLKELAGRRQVVCVTHLAQVAARADAHFQVSKHVVDGRTRTMVQSLTKEQRLEEIARMTGGRDITDVSLRHAAELIGGNDD